LPEDDSSNWILDDFRRGIYSHTEVGQSGSFLSQNFIHRFSLRQLID
jgi:hypothetical protein